MSNKIAKGSKSKLIFAPETSFGTPATAAAYKAMLFTTESLIENIGNYSSQDIRPDRQRSAVRGGNITCNGTVSCDFGIERHVVLLQHLLGISAAPTANAVTPDVITDSTAYSRGTYATAGGHLYVVKLGGTYSGTPATDFASFTSSTQAVGGVTWTYVGPDTTNVYKYTFTAGVDFPAVGLGFEKQVLGGTSDLYTLFRGGRVDSLDLNITQADIVKASWALEFLDSVSDSTSQAAPTSIINPTDDPVSGYDAFVSLNGGASTMPLRDASISIKNNIEKDVFYVGERVREDLPEGMRDISGRLTTFFKDSTEYDLFKNESTVPLVISMLHNSEYITFTCPEVKLTGSGTPQVGGSGVVTCAFDFTAFHQSGANDITVELYSTSNALFS